MATKKAQTRRSGTFKRCPTFGGCGGSGRARGMRGTDARCARCKGTGMVRAR